MSDSPKIILQAIAKGVSGARADGLTDLQPLISRSPREMVAVLSVLAEIASLPSRQQHPDASFFGLEVSHAVTGEPGSVDDLPAHIRFATQFLAAHASGEHLTAYALFNTFAEHCIREETDELGQATATLYDLAVISTRNLAEHGRRPT